MWMQKIEGVIEGVVHEELFHLMVQELLFVLISGAIIIPGP